jgi:5-formyltetrahydrofolate cyclo-ligase
MAAVTRLPEFEKAGVVGVYLAMAGEPATEPVISVGRDQGKTLCVPAFISGEAGYGMARLDEDTVLERGHFGVMEPADPTWIEAKSMDLVVVPGVGFDPRGNRLGHGKGYYDRLLADCPAARVGVALSSQWVDRVPHGPRDLPMDIVVTAEGVRRREPPSPRYDLQNKQDP